MCQVSTDVLYDFKKKKNRDNVPVILVGYHSITNVIITHVGTLFT